MLDGLAFLFLYCVCYILISFSNTCGVDGLEFLMKLSC